MNLSDRSVLVIDHGLFLSFAQSLAGPNGFGTVLYANHWRRNRPVFNELAVGRGYDGIKVVKNMWDYVDSVDVIAFPDILDGDIQTYLRKRGKAVWGSGKADDIEIYRDYSKQVIEKLGLPMNPYEVIVGITALREYLQEHDDKFIKMSFYRGIWESRKHESYWLTKTVIDRLEYTLGPLGDDMEFIVESPIKAKFEVGFDGMFITGKDGQGQFLSRAVNGVEIKDCSYLGVVQEYEDMADVFRTTNEALAPFLQAHHYCNFFSSELRKNFLIDPCMRQGSPSGESQLALWTNMPQIVWAGARGDIIEPEHEHSYVAQAMIYNKGDESEWCPVSIPKQYRGNVRLYFGYRRGAEDWVVPQVNGFDELGSVVCTSDDPQEAISQCEEIADQLGGDVSTKVEAFDEALKQFDAMQRTGINIEPVEN